MTAAETESAELKNKMDDIEYEANKAAEKLDRLDRLLTEKTQKLQYYTETGASIKIEGGKSVTGLTRAKVLCVFWTFGLEEMGGEGGRAELWLRFVDGGREGRGRGRGARIGLGVTRTRVLCRLDVWSGGNGRGVGGVMVKICRWGERGEGKGEVG